MTAIAQNRSGISVNQKAIEQLEDIANRTATETVENKLSGRTEKRTTYYLNGLDICTIIRDGNKVVEIQSGLAHHPVVDRLS